MDHSLPLAALADPTRRHIYELVARRPSPVGELAKRLPVSRPAVSQHLQLLSEAGLVQVRQEGTRRIYSANPGGLQALRVWLESLWDEVLDRYEEAAAEVAAGKERS